MGNDINAYGLSSLQAGMLKKEYAEKAMAEVAPAGLIRPLDSVNSGLRHPPLVHELLRERAEKLTQQAKRLRALARKVESIPSEEASRLISDAYDAVWRR